MDDKKTTKAQTQEGPEARPSTNRVDVTPQYLYTTVQAYNDFMVRLEQLKKYHPDWDNPRVQSRPFKRSFMTFLQNLILRLPVAPEMLPNKDGTVLLKFKKTNQPRHKWQIMEIKIYPTRYFEMVAKSRIPSQQPFTKTNMARPDDLADMVQAFYELDTVNTKAHPIRYRKATVADYPYIAALCQSIFGPHAEYHVQRISKLLQYCVVADDPMYGIVSVAAVCEHNHPEEAEYNVSILLTVEAYRGLGMASKCLRKAISELYTVHPNARIVARSILADGAVKDACQSALRRAGFKRVKIIRGDRKYKTFDCARCNTHNGYCEFTDANSCCSTAIYLSADAT